MADRSSWRGFVKRAARVAGRRFEEARRSYGEGKESAEGPSGEADDLPRDADGNARIVCRRYAERRAVAVDATGRPECFEADHPDCEGCARDVREGRVETW